MFEAMKVFDIQRAPQEIYEISHKVSGEYWGNGNDGYYIVYVNEKEVEDIGGGYISDEDSRLLLEWLMSEGAEEGEHVLVNHWW